MQDFFEFSLGARVMFQIGLAGELGQVISNALPQRRALIVADQGVVAAGLLEPIQSGISPVEIVGVFDDVPPNSSVVKVTAGAELARELGADLLIAVGGGSPIDTAKGIRILLTLGGTIPDYEGYNVIEGSLTPLVAVPTTAGTGSEVTPIAVILDEADHRKISIVSRYVTPDLAILDPMMTRTLPPRLTAATGMDALSHAIETYVSTENNPFSDSLALAAIDMIATYLRDAVHNGENMEARSQLLMAAAMAGIACGNSLFGVVHALSHALGGKFPAHHGTANAIFLPPGMRFNSEVVPERYVRIARAMGVNVGGRSEAEVIADGIAAVKTLTMDCGLPTRLRDVGVPREALPELAELAAVEPAIFNNPRPATPEELLAMLEEVW